MKEYGGYLPLELRYGKSYYYETDDMKVKELNSGKAAIYYALKESHAERIYIPFYICPSVSEIAKKAGVKIQYYYINHDFMPINVDFNPQTDILLLVNYFGILTEKIKIISLQYSRVIIDNTQAFFSKPILRTGIYNVYSCKKFIGTPDGGYLIAKELSDICLERDFSSKNMDFCIQSIEYGTGYAYDKKKDNDKRFLNEIKEMSYITRRILQNADYAFIMERRVKNFNVLHDLLRKYNRLTLPETDFVPYYYPLYMRKGIQKELVRKKVYTPILWQNLIDDSFCEKPERDFSENIVFIPLDQRYDKDDMLEIVCRIENVLEALKNTGF